LEIKNKKHFQVKSVPTPRAATVLIVKAVAVCFNEIVGKTQMARGILNGC
jgi:hypothetical protein